MSETSRPSKIRSCGASPPLSFAKVGRRSMVVAISSETEPPGTVPGHQATVGSRIPPSQVVPFRPRRGAFTDPREPPLSEVKITSVSSAIPNSRTVSRIMPTLQSTSSIWARVRRTVKSFQASALAEPGAQSPFESQCHGELAVTAVQSTASRSSPALSMNDSRAARG